MLCVYCCVVQCALLCCVAYTVVLCCEYCCVITFCIVALQISISDGAAQRFFEGESTVREGTAKNYNLTTAKFWGEKTVREGTAKNCNLTTAKFWGANTVNVVGMCFRAVLCVHVLLCCVVCILLCCVVCILLCCGVYTVALWCVYCCVVVSLSLCRAWLLAVSQRRPLNMTQTAFVERAGRE